MLGKTEDTIQGLVIHLELQLLYKMIKIYLNTPNFWNVQIFNTRKAK